MKATGIVRRIDDYVIIGARSENLENTGVSLILPNFCAPADHGQEDFRRWGRRLPLLLADSILPEPAFFFAHISYHYHIWLRSFR